jgi:hypothetical protein
MVVNDNAYFLVLRGVLAFIASKLAPTVDPYWSHMACPLKTHCGSESARDEVSRGNESLCLLNFFLQSQPARSCVKDYDYFRIRRLVRLFGGFYLLRVAAHQRSGLVARISRRMTTPLAGFFVSASMVVMRGALSSAPAPWTGLPTCVWLPPFVW